MTDPLRAAQHFAAYQPFRETLQLQELQLIHAGSITGDPRQLQSDPWDLREYCYAVAGRHVVAVRVECLPIHTRIFAHSCATCLVSSAHQARQVFLNSLVKLVPAVVGQEARRGILSCARVTFQTYRSHKPLLSLGA